MFFWMVRSLTPQTSPSPKCMLPPGESDWTYIDNERCCLLQNYFDPSYNNNSDQNWTKFLKVETIASLFCCHCGRLVVICNDVRWIWLWFWIHTVQQWLEVDALTSVFLQLLSLVSLATWFNILISATVTQGWLSCALHVGVLAEWSFQFDASRVGRWLATNGRLTSACCRRTTQKGTYRSLPVTSSICFL